MENASNALIMAAGVLIGILILSLGVYLFVDFGQTSAQIHEQNEQKQLTQFNSKFTSYEGKEELTIYDIITVAGYAYENNEYYENDNEFKIFVLIETTQIQDDINEKRNELIENEQSQITATNTELPTYNCKIEYENGRVRKVIFKKN